MEQQEVKAEGECDMLSVQPAPQREDMPKTETEDTVMSDRNTTEVQSQDQALDGVVDMQIISKKEFDNLPDSDLPRDFMVAASKSLGENSVERKPDIESIKVQVVVLDDQLGDTARDRGLEQARAQLATTKQALQNGKAHWRRQNEMVKNLRADLKQSKDKVRDVKAINSDLQEKLVTSQKELTMCRDDLFNLQPMVQVADSTIVEALEIVDQEVVSWIETEVASYEKTHPGAEEEHIFSVGDNRDAAIFLAHHPGAGEHFARYLVYRFLQANLFGRKYNLLGLKGKTAQLLQEAEHSMANFDPPRDPASIAAWRSETLQALAAIKKCQHIRKIQLQEINDHLFRELGWTFPMFSTRRDSMERFYQQVLEPAAKVATMIQTSASTYRYSMSDHPFRKWEPLSLRHMKTHRMLDIKNGSYLKANAAVVADEQGIIGKFIIPLEPGLYRMKEGKDETRLRQVTYLVELNHPVAKSS